LTFENGLLKFNRAGGPPSYPDLQLWDYTQRALRDMATEAKRAGRNDEAGALTALHHQLLEELDKRVPEFAAARGTARFFKGAENAYDAGKNFVMTNSDRDAARAALRKMSSQERELFAHGFAAELVDKVLGIRDGRNVLNSIFLDSPAARQKVMIALGPQRAAELEAFLRSEETVDRLRQALLGSTTARQFAEMGLAGGAVATYEGLKEKSFNPAHIIAVALTVGAARHGAKVIDEKVARRVGEMLASSDPAILARGLKVVASRPILMDALRQATNVSTRELINALGPSDTAAGAAALYHNLLVEPRSEKLPGGGYDQYYQDDYERSESGVP